MAGSRHPKRWQDIEDLLAAGIDVWTTVNVQHLDSLNEAVGSITGIRVWETVPDAVFEQTLAAAGASFKAHGFRLVVFIGDHGGYQKAIVHAVARMNQAWAKSPTRALAPSEYYAASTDGFAHWLRAHGYRDDEIGTHAALADTSLALYAAPETVRTEALKAGKNFDTAHGVYGGDPRRASAELGRAGAEFIVNATVEAIRRAQAGH